MSQQKANLPEGDQERLLKEELRSLPKVPAPWYFESDVLRRIRKAEPATRWLRRPVPAVAVSSLGIVVLGIIGYFLYFSVPVDPGTSPARDAQTGPPAPSPQLSSHPQPAARDQERSSQSSRTREEVAPVPGEDRVHQQPRSVTPEDQPVQPRETSAAISESTVATHPMIRPSVADTSKGSDSSKLGDMVRTRVDSSRLKGSAGKPAAPRDSIR